MAMAAEGSHMSDSSNIRDPELWGNLQHHISLVSVYVKLPVRDFFRYRSVCKYWNRLAGDREFLMETFNDRHISEPYFFLESWFMGEQKFLLLAREHVTGFWSTSWLPSNCSSCQLLAWSCQGGLALYNMVGKDGEDQLRVFNFHTRVVTHLPPTPLKPICNIIDEHRLSNVIRIVVVDRSVRPYAWWLIQGSEGSSMQTYDSRRNTWLISSEVFVESRYPTLPSQMFDDSSREQVERGILEQTGPVVYKHNVEMYSQCTGDFPIYGIGSDMWLLQKLPLPVPGCFSCMPAGCMGTWQGSVFILPVKCMVDDDSKHEIRVWKLDSMLEWVEFSCMPAELCCWLHSNSGHPLPADMVVGMRVSYCEGYFLVYGWLCTETPMISKAERFALFNLDTKVWQKLEVPFGAIHAGANLYPKGSEEPPCNYRRYPYWCSPRSADLSHLLHLM